MKIKDKLKIHMHDKLFIKEAQKRRISGLNNKRTLELKGKKAVIGLVQDLKDPVAGELAIKAYEHVIGGTFMMDIVEKIHVADVRDVGDIKKKTKQLEEIFALGKKYATG